MRFGLLYEAQRPSETIPHERALSSIEMIGKYVIPACRAEARTKPIPAGV